MLRPATKCCGSSAPSPLPKADIGLCCARTDQQACARPNPSRPTLLVDHPANPHVVSVPRFNLRTTAQFPTPHISAASDAQTNCVLITASSHDARGIKFAFSTPFQKIALTTAYIPAKSADRQWTFAASLTADNALFCTRSYCQFQPTAVELLLEHPSYIGSIHRRHLDQTARTPISVSPSEKR